MDLLLNMNHFCPNGIHNHVPNSERKSEWHARMATVGINKVDMTLLFSYYLPQLILPVCSYVWWLISYTEKYMGSIYISFDSGRAVADLCDRLEGHLETHLPFYQKLSILWSPKMAASKLTINLLSWRMCRCYGNTI